MYQHPIAVTTYAVAWSQKAKRKRGNLLYPVRSISSESFFLCDCHRLWLKGLGRTLSSLLYSSDYWAGSEEAIRVSGCESEKRERREAAELELGLRL